MSSQYDVSDLSFDVPEGSGELTPDQVLEINQALADFNATPSSLAWSLDPDHHLYRTVLDEQGPMLADELLRTHNQACVNYAGFEQWMTQLNIPPHDFAWSNNTSRVMN
ncbi:MAG: hypothetical protein ACRCZG_06045 [Culicoidibacterales bacterium]